MFSSIDTFRCCLAFLPVAAYLVALGVVNLRRRPVLVSGTKDMAALGLALGGLFVIGPIELFFPISASIRFGPYVWVFLIALYGLCVVLVLLLMRPRLVVYNLSAEELRPILTEVARQLDRDARWAGESLAMPRLGVQLHMEGYGRMRNVVLAAVGDHQNPEGWQRLEMALRSSLDRLEVPRNRWGLALLATGCLIIAVLGLAVAQDPAAVARSLAEMLRIQ